MITLYDAYSMSFKERFTLPNIQREAFNNPELTAAEAYERVYHQDYLAVGWPTEEQRIYEHLSRANTTAVVGVALGDEGKGRIVDNKLLLFYQS